MTIYVRFLLLAALVVSCSLPMQPTEGETTALALSTAGCAVGCTSTAEPPPPAPDPDPEPPPPEPSPPPPEPTPPPPDPEPEPPPVPAPTSCTIPGQGIVDGPKKCKDFGNFVSEANDKSDFVLARCIVENDDGSLPWFVLLPTDDLGNFPWWFAEENCDNEQTGSRNKVWRVDGCKCK